MGANVMITAKVSLFQMRCFDPQALTSSSFMLWCRKGNGMCKSGENGVKNNWVWLSLSVTAYLTWFTV